MRRLAVATATTVVLALAGACSGGADAPEAKASQSAEPKDPRAPVIEEIEALPEVDLDDVKGPKAPDGFAQEETDLYADTVEELMESSLTDETWWSAEPDKSTIGTFLEPAPAETRTAVLEGDYVNGDDPVAQFMTSIFDEDSQPVAPPRIVKAVWTTETYVPEGWDGPVQRVKLGVFAAYRVGEEKLPVLVRREIFLNGRNALAPGAWPGLGYYTFVDGVDTCTLYDEGVYEAVLPSEKADVSGYEAWLEQARAKKWASLGTAVEEGDDTATKRSKSCADRSES